MKVKDLERRAKTEKKISWTRRIQNIMAAPSRALNRLNGPPKGTGWSHLSNKQKAYRIIKTQDRIRR